MPADTSEEQNGLIDQAGKLSDRVTFTPRILATPSSAYGGLQNLTLAQAFTAAGEPARFSVSIVWNLSFDARTGLGAFAAGAVATATSYSIAFALLAPAPGIVGGCWTLRRGG